MIEISGPLGFHVPEQTPSSGASFLLNPKDTAAWVVGLPLANIGETSRQVFKTIVEFNRTRIPSLMRIRVAEHFREPVAYVAKNLEKYVVDASFPLSARSRKVAILSRELYSELAIAYKSAIEDMLSTDRAEFDQKMLTIAIQRAMSYLAYVLLQSTLIYDPCPDSLWKEVHLLYSYAQRNNLDRLEVKDQGDKEAEAETIRDAYKKILLFSLSAPYQLRQRDTLRIFSGLGDWSTHARLVADGIQGDSYARFLVDPRGEEPPEHLSLYEQTSTDGHLILDNRELIKKLRDDFDKNSDAERESADSSLAGSSTSLLRHLIYSWSSAPRREFVRTKLHFELRVAIGLKAIHALIVTNTKLMSAETESNEIDDGMDWLDEQLNNSKILQSGLHSGQGNLTVSEIPRHERREHDRHGFEEFGPGSQDRPVVQDEPVWDAAVMPMPNHETFSFRTLNESAGGYCLGWQGQNAPGMRVGELIGVQSATNPAQFGVGIARWLKHIPGHGLQLGIQMISPNAVAVEASSEITSDSTPHQCLLLPEIAAAGQPASLVTPAMRNRTGSVVRIEEGNSIRKARYTRLLEATGAFHQYQCEFLDKDAREKSKEDDSSERDFDSIWSKI